MTSRTSLRVRLGWWFAASLLVLYGTGALLGWFYARTTARQYAVLTLKTEAEDVAGYVNETGRFDSPELAAPEHAPIPLWLRVVKDGRVAAVTPGAPEIPLPSRAEAAEIVSASFLDAGFPCVVVRHRVGSTHEGTIVEAIGSMEPLLRRERHLAASLVLVGLVVIPLAALGGRLLAARALRPVDDLVAGIEALDSARLGARLRLAQGGVEEVVVLTRAFNGLLERLEETIESMRRFTADASHEIRNPLSVLRSGLEITLRRERTPEEYRALMRENLQEIERLHAVVEGLLAMARRVPGSEYTCQRATLDLSGVVEKTLQSFETVAAERGVRFDAAVEPEVLVEGDEGLLRLVAFNLVDNALKHGPDGESISVALARDGDRARLVVSDRGPGVAPEDRPHLFERFYRGGEAGSGVGGLGLSVVRWVAEIHGGAVRLLDGERGAAFEVVLPAK